MPIHSPAIVCMNIDHLNKPKWIDNNRDRKAAQIAHVLKWSDWLPLPEHQCTLVDLGCGSGHIAAALSQQFGKVIGIDPESRAGWPTLCEANKNLRLIQSGFSQAGLLPGSVHVLVCNQVYEHVENPKALIDTIYALLAPGGIAYFAGPNRLFPIEPHVYWPLIHWLPLRLAQRVMKALGARTIMDATSVTWWTLKSWLSSFEIKEGISAVIAHRLNPRNGDSTAPTTRVISRLASSFMWAAPGFILILRKSGSASDSQDRADSSKFQGQPGRSSQLPKCVQP